MQNIQPWKSLKGPWNYTFYHHLPNTWFQLLLDLNLKNNFSDRVVCLFLSRRNDFSTTQQAVEVDSIVLTCPEVPGRVHSSPHTSHSRGDASMGKLCSSAERKELCVCVAWTSSLLLPAEEEISGLPHSSWLRGEGGSLTETTPRILNWNACFHSLCLFLVDMMEDVSRRRLGG